MSVKCDQNYSDRRCPGPAEGRTWKNATLRLHPPVFCVWRYATWGCFPKVKVTMKGQRFESVQDIEAARTEQLKTLMEEDAGAAVDMAGMDLDSESEGHEGRNEEPCSCWTTNLWPGPALMATVMKEELRDQQDPSSVIRRTPAAWTRVATHPKWEGEGVTRSPATLALSKVTANLGPAEPKLSVAVLAIYQQTLQPEESMVAWHLPPSGSS
ncbi:hypothetical protein H920_15072 [Fukomys damarensis]|uniref:Uncharacterized protein n=1 Tax=Fukomys damarensis TaxID=885580 RepID=A0A091D004_FUKDA|nr:hypothetical protein H920_15072 [Fukomys damarensis]